MCGAGRQTTGWEGGVGVDARDGDGEARAQLIGRELRERLGHGERALVQSRYRGYAEQRRVLAQE